MKVAILKSKSLIYTILVAISLSLGCISYNISDQTRGPIPTDEITDESKDTIRQEASNNAHTNNNTPISGPKSRIGTFHKKLSIMEEPLVKPNSNNNASEATSLGITLNNEIVEYLLRFHLKQRKVFAEWLKRSGRYLPLMRRILQKHGLPEELVYLALIESGFNPMALSSAKASGPWQFMPDTGQRYGLKINSWVDERRDPLKSTEAAAKYLRDLYMLFGCWTLTVASYNAGEGAVLSAIEKADSWDFWTLAKNNYLPPQTREFVPKFMAATIIGKEYEEFGFKDLNFLPPLQFDFVTVKGGTPLSLIAKYSGINYKKIKRLNPELKKGVTPPNVDTYKLKIPAGRKKTFLKKWNKWKNRLSTVDDRTKTYYQVKKGDTLWHLSKKYNVSLQELGRLNSLKDPSRLQLNQILLIPNGHET